MSSADDAPTVAGMSRSTLELSTLHTQTHTFSFIPLLRKTVCSKAKHKNCKQIKRSQRKSREHMTTKLTYASGKCAPRKVSEWVRGQKAKQSKKAAHTHTHTSYMVELRGQMPRETRNRERWFSFYLRFTPCVCVWVQMQKVASTYASYENRALITGECDYGERVNHCERDR